MRTLPLPRNRAENGSALAAVLGLVFIASMLTTMVLTISKTAAFDLAAHTALQRSFYINEGVGNRVQWLIAADTALYGNNTILGETDYEEEETERFLPDGTEHTLSYHGTPVKVVITDAVSGYPLCSGGSSILKAISRYWSEDDPDKSDKIDIFLERQQDYLDSDDEISGDDGWEEAEYEDAGKAPLPRNGTIQFREELFYIPGFAELFPPDRNGRLSGIMLPQIESRVNNTRTVSFFTAGEEMIRLYSNLEDDQIESVLTAREEWFKERTPLSESLDGSVYQLLLSNFLWQTSGYYTVRISAPADAKRPSGELIFTYQGFDVGGPDNQSVTFFEYRSD